MIGQTLAKRIAEGALLKEKFLEPLNMARLYVSLREKDKAIVWLERAY